MQRPLDIEEVAHSREDAGGEEEDEGGDDNVGEEVWVPAGADAGEGGEGACLPAGPGSGQFRPDPFC
jgi:hypothetical protein